ncbi:hypothetical protein MBLNU13_g03149t1 [Cladosporium sp. NU13]
MYSPTIQVGLAIAGSRVKRSFQELGEFCTIHFARVLVCCVLPFPVGAIISLAPRVWSWFFRSWPHRLAQEMEERIEVLRIETLAINSRLKAEYGWTDEQFERLLQHRGDNDEAAEARLASFAEENAAREEEERKKKEIIKLPARWFEAGTCVSAFAAQIPRLLLAKSRIWTFEMRLSDGQDLKLTEERTSKAGLIKIMNEIRADAKTTRNKAHQCEDKKAKAKKREQKLGQECTDSKRELAEEVEIETAPADNKHLKTEHELDSVLKIHVETKLANLKATAKNREADLETEMSKNKRLQIENKAMHVQNCSVHEEIGRIKVVNQNLEQEPERLRQACDVLQNRFDEAQSTANTEKGGLEVRLRDLELRLQAKDQQVLSGQQEHQAALEAKDAERAETVSSQEATIVKLQKSIDETRDTSSKQDKELKDMQAKLTAAEKESQDFKERLRLASMKMDELHVEADESEDDEEDGNEIGDGGNAETNDSVMLDRPTPQAETNE